MQETVRLIRTLFQYVDQGQLHELTFEITPPGPCSMYFDAGDLAVARRTLGSQEENEVDPASPGNLPDWASHRVIGSDPGGGIARTSCWHDCYCRYWCFSRRVRLIFVSYQYAYMGQLHELRFSASEDGPCSIYFNTDEARRVSEAIGSTGSTTIDPGEPSGLPPYVRHSVLGRSPDGGVAFPGCIWHDCYCRWWCFPMTTTTTARSTTPTTTKT